MNSDGMGDTAEEAKKEAIASAGIFKEENSPENIPKELKGDYELVFKYDAESLL